jgi:hypothetical protein
MNSTRVRSAPGSAACALVGERGLAVADVEISDHGFASHERRVHVEVRDGAELVEQVLANSSAALNECAPPPRAHDLWSQPLSERLEETIRSDRLRVDAAPEAHVLVGHFVERLAHRVPPRRDVDADGQVQRGRRRSSSPGGASRAGGRACRPRRIVTSITGSPGSPISAVYFWLLQRQLEDGRVDEPALLALDLEAETSCVSWCTLKPCALAGV